MLHEENAIPSQPDTPNELCQLIHDYTRFTGCYPDSKGWSGEYDPKVIRADLAAYLKRAAMNQAPRFRPIQLQRQVIMQDFDFPLLDWSDYITIPFKGAVYRGSLSFFLPKICQCHDICHFVITDRFTIFSMIYFAIFSTAKVMNRSIFKGYYLCFCKGSKGRIYAGSKARIRE